MTVITSPAFPALTPASRKYTGGDYPVAKYESQSGVEVRILYGDKRVGHTLSLTYNNISDANAELFFEHYEATKGTYHTFKIPDIAANKAGARNGWAGTTDFLNAGVGVQWRYANPPQLTSVYPGFSKVSIKLIAVGAVV